MAQYFIVDTENVGQRALVGAFDQRQPGMSDVLQAFMMEGRLLLEFYGHDPAREDKIQSAVWSVNHGAYCGVQELSGDQFDAYC